MSSAPALKAVKDQITEPDYKLLHQQLLCVDDKLGFQIAQEQAQASATKMQCAETTRLEFEREEIDEEYASSKTIGDELELQKRTTPRFVVRNTGAGEPEKRLPFLKWGLMNQVGFLLSLSGMLVALLVGTANVFSNLQASNPLFYEQPALAWLIALLMPLGSLSIKFISHIFITYRNKKRFALAVYSLSAITLLVWTIAFAMNFAGVSAGIDWDSLGESNSKGSFLVWLQLTAEILVAAALAMAADEIYQKHNPDTLVENKEYQRICLLLEEHKREHQVLHDKRCEIYGRIAELEAEHTILTNERLVDFAALRGRFQR